MTQAQFTQTCNLKKTNLDRLERETSEVAALWYLYLYLREATSSMSRSRDAPILPGIPAVLDQFKGTFRDGLLLGKSQVLQRSRLPFIFILTLWSKTKIKAPESKTVNLENSWNLSQKNTPESLLRNLFLDYPEITVVNDKNVKKYNGWELSCSLHYFRCVDIYRILDVDWRRLI